MDITKKCFSLARLHMQAAITTFSHSVRWRARTQVFRIVPLVASAAMETLATEWGWHMENRLRLLHLPGDNTFVLKHWCFETSTMWSQCLLELLRLGKTGCGRWGVDHCLEILLPAQVYKLAGVLFNNLLFSRLHLNPRRVAVLQHMSVRAFIPACLLLVFTTAVPFFCVQHK